MADKAADLTGIGSRKLLLEFLRKVSWCNSWIQGYTSAEVFFCSFLQYFGGTSRASEGVASSLLIPVVHSKPQVNKK